MAGRTCEAPHLGATLEGSSFRARFTTTQDWLGADVNGAGAGEAEAPGEAAAEAVAVMQGRANARQDAHAYKAATVALSARWPARDKEIKQLLGYLGSSRFDHAFPILVHGPPVTGKSFIVKDVFATLK